LSLSAIAVFVLTLSSDVHAGTSSSSTDAAASRCGWKVSPFRVRGELYGLTAINRRNVWAVGSTNEDQPRPLALHWLGTGWKRVGVPETHASWSAVAFTTPSDGWAVGGSVGPGVGIARWDGRRWMAVPGADLGNRRAGLDDAAAVGKDDVWAVGSASIAAAKAGVLVEHWDGSRWRVVPTPDVGQSQLSAVAAISRTDVWAVGNQIDNTLIEHWDGERWGLIPNPAAPVGRLEDIAAISARDIWTVGTRGAWPARQTPLIEHWDGTRWRVVAAPARQTKSFSSVEVLSSGDIWVSGGDIDSRATLLHRRGTRWAAVPTPQVKGLFKLQIAAARTDDIWGIASVANFSDTRPRMAHYGCQS
jgi:hypothetical protein